MNRRRQLPARWALSCVVLGVVLWAILSVQRQPAPTPSASVPAAKRAAASQRTLDVLLAMLPEELAKVDIAEMNLTCAAGLPGAKNLDAGRILSTLDAWANAVRMETDRHWHQFRRNPAEYNHSAGYFRMLMLVSILQQDMGVRYNPDRIRDVDFRNSKDLFIHGLVGDDNGGTCVSMPVLYTAVARRLGYPVKLVLAKEHVFCRWDASDDRFNIEATNRGLSTHSDDYYKTWPHAISDDELKTYHFLASLGPAEELACFLASRGACLLDNRRGKESLEAYSAAARLAPRDPCYRAWVNLLSNAGRKDRPRLGYDAHEADNNLYFDLDQVNALGQAAQTSAAWRPGATTGQNAGHTNTPHPNHRYSVSEAQQPSLRSPQPWRQPQPSFQPNHRFNSERSRP